MDSSRPKDIRNGADFSGIKHEHITTREQLNEWETENILIAEKKYLLKKQKINFDAVIFKKIHKDMFDNTWDWAGEFRKSNLNIGSDWKLISQEIKLLCDDMKYWINNKSMNIIEQSVRIHHRLVKIHPFNNGNGRHARLLSNIFLYNNDHSIIEWPGKEFIEKTNIRNDYISALKIADSGDYSNIIRFTLNLIKKNKDGSIIR